MLDLLQGRDREKHWQASELLSLETLHTAVEIPIFDVR